MLAREGPTLATYGLESGPLGYRPLREFLAAKLSRSAGISCTADEILITSGSLQAIDLVNGILLARGDTVLIEQESYEGSLTRLARLGSQCGRHSARWRRPADGRARGRARRPPAPRQSAEIHLHHPDRAEPDRHHHGAAAPASSCCGWPHDHGVPIFEDDCYSDLVWNGERPPALYAMSKHGGVIHIGSFSKSIAPALRVGYIVAGWDMLSRMLALKTDAGSGALEQMVLAEFCEPDFKEHVRTLTRGLRAKLETLMEALAEQFGTAAEFDDPKGGIYLWVKLPDEVDTLRLAQAALAGGIAINPGPDWTTDKAHGRSRLRLCFAHPSHQAIREGIAALAVVCRREFGVPARIANVTRAGSEAR